MKNYKSALGNIIVMWIVGLSPVIFPSLYFVFSDGKYLNIGMAIAMLLGGFLSIYVMKKEYHVNIKNYLRKPDTKTSLLVMATAVFYVITVMYVVYMPLMEGETEIDALKVVELTFFSIASPIGEELVFRFSMLTLLLIAAQNSRIKTVFSIVLVSVLWMMIHFSGNSLRSIDIIIVGMMLGFIFLKSKNIIYCIMFHITANVITYSVAVFNQWFLEREYILFISVPMFLLFFVTLSYRLCRSADIEFAFSECEAKG